MSMEKLEPADVSLQQLESLSRLRRGANIAATGLAILLAQEAVEVGFNTGFFENELASFVTAEPSCGSIDPIDIQNNTIRLAAIAAEPSDELAFSTSIAAAEDRYADTSGVNLLDVAPALTAINTATSAQEVFAIANATLEPVGVHITLEKPTIEGLPYPGLLQAMGVNLREELYYANLNIEPTYFDTESLSSEDAGTIASLALRRYARVPKELIVSQGVSTLVITEGITDTAEDKALDGFIVPVDSSIAFVTSKSLGRRDSDIIGHESAHAAINHRYGKNNIPCEFTLTNPDDFGYRDNGSNIAYKNGRQTMTTAAGRVSLTDYAATRPVEDWADTSAVTLTPAYAARTLEAIVAEGYDHLPVAEQAAALQADTRIQKMAIVLAAADQAAPGASAYTLGMTEFMLTKNTTF